MYDKIIEFENRLESHQEYTFRRYNQLKTVIVYLKSYFDNGGCLTDRQIQLDMDMELENEIECLQSLRYSDDKDADFILRVNTTLRIVGIMKNYIPEPAASPQTDSLWTYVKQRLFPEQEYSPFDFIYKITATWAQG